MTTGIYFAHFSAGSHNSGEGLVVLSGGNINGGDETYLYRGYLDAYAQQVRAKIEVTHYRGSLNSVFGPLRHFTLELAGIADDQSFDIRGSIVGVPSPEIRIIGRKVAPLYERGV